MSELTPKQIRLLEKAKKFGTSKELATAESFMELEDKVDQIAESVDTKLSSLEESLKKKLESELVLEIDREELKGDVGEQGAKGEKGDRGERGEKGDKGDTTVVEKVIERTETIREIPFITKEVIEVAKTDKKTLKQIAEIEKTTKNLMEYEIPTLQNRTQLLNQLVSGVRKDVTDLQAEDVEDDLLHVPYTGATTTVNLGSQKLTTTGNLSGTEFYLNTIPFKTNTSGTNLKTSIFAGTNAGTTTAYWSVALGLDALSGVASNSTTVIAIGYKAGAKNTTAYTVTNSIFLGTNAGYNSNGTSNMHFGTSSGINSTGSNNTYVGFNTGSGTTGGGNTFFGFNSGASSQGSNSAGFGPSTFSGAFHNASVAIGQAAFSGSNNPGGGNFAAGYQAGNGSTSCQYVFFLGENVGRDATGCQSTFMAGGSAGYGATNVDNGIYMGQGAGQAAFNATNVVALGSNAGASATGNYNSYIGQGAGQSANGNYNLFLGPSSGQGSLADNTVAIGQDSGGQQINVLQGFFLGAYTGSLAYYATYGTYIGLAAGYAAERASRSVFIGTSCGYGAKDAASSLWIGNYAGVNDTVDTAYRGGVANTVRIYNGGYLWNVDDEATVTSGDGNAVVKVTAIDYGGAGTASVSNGGSYYMVGDQVYLEGGFSDCICEVTSIDGIAGEMLTAEVAAGGSSYTIGDVLSVDYGYNGYITVTDIDGASGEVYGTVDANGDGSGYAIGDQIYISSGDTLCLLQVESVGGSGEVLSVSILAGGSQYYVASGFGTTVSTGSGDGNATVNINSVYSAAITDFTINPGSGLYYVQQYACSGGTGSGAYINVLTVDTTTYAGAVTSLNVISPGSNYQISTYNTQNYSGYYYGSGLSVNIDTMVLGTATAVSVVTAGTGYKQGGQAGEHPTTGISPSTGYDLSIIIDTLASEASNGYSMLFGDFTSTGGYKNSMSIGYGTMNSASQQANIGNVLFLDGIYNSSTTSSTPISLAKMTMLGGVVGGVTTVTDTYTILSTDRTVVGNKATPFTITLPPGVVGTEYRVGSIGAGVITLDANGTETINGNLTQTIAKDEGYTIVCIASGKWMAF